MRFFVITCHYVLNVWPKTTLLLPVWHRDAKRLDTPAKGGTGHETGKAGVHAACHHERQGLALDGCFIQMAGVRRACYVPYKTVLHFLSSQPYIAFQASLFYKEENVWVRDLELRKKVNQIKAAVQSGNSPSILSSLAQ